MEFAGSTHTGRKRKKNEDRYLITELPDKAKLLVVADGMGGHPGGEQASELVVNSFKGFNLEKLKNNTADKALAQAITQANNEILKCGDNNPELAGMGSTALAVLLLGETVYWSHVGDSRFYLLRNEKLKQVTTDQTFLRELVEHGDMSAEEADAHPFRNMLDQCVGCDKCAPEQGVIKLQPNDRLLLCSDGLHHELEKERIAELLAKNAPAYEIVKQMLQAALKSGGKDNITVIVGV